MKTFNRIFRPKRALSASLSQALSGALLVEHRACEGMIAELGARIRSATGAEIRAYLDAAQASAFEAAGYEMEGGVAHIVIQGFIVADRSDAELLRYYGIECTVTDEILEAVAAAVVDPRCEAIELNVNSPGGTATGVPECAAAIAEAAEMKPVEASVRGMCCSAAYWMASQAGAIRAEPSSVIGSIGAFTAIADSSKFYGELGIKIHLLASGPHKGVGTSGVEISDEQLAKLKSNIDTLAAMFVTAVARGRGMSIEATRAIATGEAWYATDAKSKGLVDQIAGPSIAPKKDGPHQEPDGDEPPPAPPGSSAEAAAPPAKALRSEEETAAADPPPIIRGEPDANVVERDERMTFTKKTPSEEAEALRAEVTALKQERDDANARAQVAEAFAHAARAQELTAVIDKHVTAGRVTPAIRPAIEEASKAFGGRAEAFDAMLSTFPVQVKPAATGQAPAEPWMTPKIAGLKPQERAEAEKKWKGFVSTLASNDAIQSLRRGPSGEYTKIPAEGDKQ